jgi:hypothetical protein
MLSMQIPTAAAKAELLEPGGKVRRLEETWAERPVVLVFLRHFS